MLPVQNFLFFCTEFWQP